MTRDVSSEVVQSGDFTSRMWEFAEKICKAKFLSRVTQGDPASTFFLIATAQDLGLRWTHGLRSMYLAADGKVGMQGDVMLALLLGRGFKVSFEGSDKTKGCCTIERPEPAKQEQNTNPTTLTWTFTMDDAKAIRRWDNDAKAWRPLADKESYRNYPQNMLMWRALANCARFIAADVLGGIYLPDELEDIGAPSGPSSDGTDHEEQSTLSVGLKDSGSAIVASTEPSATDRSAQGSDTPSDQSGTTVTTPDSIKARIAQVKVKLGGDRSADRIVKEFFRGFFGSDTLPSKPLMYVDAVTHLERQVETNHNGLVSNPRACGASVADGKSNTFASLSKELGLGPDVEPLLESISTRRAMSPDELRQWFDVLNLKSFTADDIKAFLSLAASHRGAYLLLDVAEQRKSTPAAMAKELSGKDDSQIQAILDKWEAEVGSLFPVDTADGGR